MQGRNQFQGGVPSNMNFPTDTYVSAHGQAYRDVGNAYARAAEIESQAKQKMVDSIMQGALQGLGAYQKGVAAEKDFAAGRAAVESPTFQKMLGLDAKSGASYGQFLDQLKSDQGVEAANRFMQTSTPGLMKFGQMQQQYNFDLGLQNARNAGALGVANVRSGTDTGRKPLTPVTFD